MKHRKKILPITGEKSKKEKNRSMKEKHGIYRERGNLPVIKPEERLLPLVRYATIFSSLLHKHKKFGNYVFPDCIGD